VRELAEQPGETDPGEAHIDESTDEESLVVLNYPTSSKGDDDHADYSHRREHLLRVEGTGRAVHRL